jgi:hypothetical protein
VIHFALGAYQSAIECRANHIKILTEKLKSAEKWVKSKSKLLKDGGKFYGKKNWKKSKTGSISMIIGMLLFSLPPSLFPQFPVQFTMVVLV